MVQAWARGHFRFPALRYALFNSQSPVAGGIFIASARADMQKMVAEPPPADQEASSEPPARSLVVATVGSASAKSA